MCRGMANVDSADPSNEELVANIEQFQKEMSKKSKAVILRQISDLIRHNKALRLKLKRGKRKNSPSPTSPTKDFTQSTDAKPNVDLSKELLKENHQINLRQ